MLQPACERLERLLGLPTARRKVSMDLYGGGGLMQGNRWGKCPGKKFDLELAARLGLGTPIPANAN